MRLTRVAMTAALLSLAAGCAAAGPAAVDERPAAIATTTAAGEVDLPTVTVHKTAACECCGRYEEYLAVHGVEVEVVLHDDVGPYKDEVGVPADQRSCHTNEVDGYFVEGHVPIEAIATLLEQAPEVVGELGRF